MIHQTLKNMFGAIPALQYIESVSVRAVWSILLETRISLISCVLQDIQVPILKPQSV